MNILLTGASSFTGLWFAKALTRAGHRVAAPLRRARADYEGLRRDRVETVGEFAELIENCSFGSERFLELARSDHWDALCHHAAEVGDYRSPDFSIDGALGANTHNLRTVIETMRARGLKAVILTGSVFEEGEGAGTAPLAAFSPYGLSKGLTAAVMRHYCREVGARFAKFVIPNPFGPFEEPRFCSYLVRTWKAGETASVKTPAYIRDNIHVDLLAAAYGRFVDKALAAPAGAQLQLNPSQYAETQGAFATRFQRELAPRLKLECELELMAQTDFPEPFARINTDPAIALTDDWDETAAWDALADFYR